MHDDDPTICAAREDAAQEGARVVRMTVVELWRLIHRVPTLTAAEREQLGAPLLTSG